MEKQWPQLLNMYFYRCDFIISWLCDLKKSMNFFS